VTPGTSSRRSASGTTLPGWTVTRTKAVIMLRGAFVGASDRSGRAR
jgi:hypothetical protein